MLALWCDRQLFPEDFEASAAAAAATRQLTQQERAPAARGPAQASPSVSVAPMFGKPSTRVVTFEKMSMESSMVYHRIYHYSWKIALNHLLFLNTYVLGVMLTVESCGGSIALYTVSSLYAAYSLVMSRGAALPYAGCIAMLCSGAQLATKALRSAGLDHAWEVLCLGLSVVLLSFMAQLAGHAFHEDFSAPPDLFHGFVAAPVLESISLQMRLGLMPQLKSQVDREVQRVRSEARGMAQEHCRQE